MDNQQNIDCGDQPEEEVSDFVADCRRIEEWGKEQGRVWLKYVMDRPGQTINPRDLPLVAIDLPSRRRAAVRQAEQGDSSVENPLTPQV
jgi:hypothetical protein